jgi:adenosine deaminase
MLRIISLNGYLRTIHSFFRPNPLKESAGVRKPTPKKVSIKKIPKAELHLHLEGSMEPALIRKLAAKYNITLDSALFKKTEKSELLAWNDFFDFLKKYDEASKVACCEDAVTEITYDYLRRCHEQGSIYNELAVSPDHLARFDMDYSQAIRAVEAGIDRAKKEFGIDSRIIVVLLRHGLKPDYNDLEKSRLLAKKQAEELAKLVAANKDKHKYVRGVGLAGDEKNFGPALFVDAFNVARNAGMNLTAHAGEWTSAQNVLDTINSLSVSRIGHGIHAAFDHKILSEIIKKDIHLELCPNSNHSLNTKKHYPEEHEDITHPLKMLHQSGVRYSLSSDDPPYFVTNLLLEYRFAQSELRLDTKGLLKITWTAIEDSFAEDTLKDELKAKIIKFAEEHGIDFNPRAKEEQPQQRRERGMTV